MEMKKEVVEDEKKEPKNNNPPKEWSNLLPEILNIISTKLHDHNSSTNKELRLVCKNWESSVDPPFVNLDSFLPISFSFSESLTYLPFRLVPTAVYLLRSLPPSKSGWWLVSVEQSNPDKVRACHPLTGSIIPHNLVKGIPPNLEFVELGKGCNLRCADGINSFFIDKPVGFCVSKVVLWRNPEDGFNDYSLVMLFDQGTLDFFRVPCSDVEGVYYGKGWKRGKYLQPITGQPSKVTRVDDIELWKGVVWIVDSAGQLFKIDYKSFNVTIVSVNRVSVTACGSKRLVVSRNGDDQSEDLYMVVCNRKCCDDDQFAIFTLDSEDEWVKVGSLGDNILFLGYRTCFFARTQHLRFIQGGTIIFPINLYPCYTGETTTQSLRNVDVEDLELLEVADYLKMRITRYAAKGADYFDHSKLLNHIAPLFWPPPVPISKSEVAESDQRNVGSTSNDSTSASGKEAM